LAFGDQGMRGVRSEGVVGTLKRIEADANQPVQFTGLIEAPPGTGTIVGTGWWFGEDMPRYQINPVDEPKQTIEVKNTHTYKNPGVYYVTLFATSQREGNTSDTMTSIQNLDRVRVVVR
jgi:PKD repeat protein